MSKMKESMKYYTGEISKCLKAVTVEMELLLQSVKYVIESNKQIFVIGNGGSLTIAEHFVEDLKMRYSKIFVLDNSPLITALANDFGYDVVFRKQLKGLINKGDLLIALSVSGKSRNIIQAVSHAEEVGASIAVLTGQDGGALANRFCIKISSLSYGIVECCHLCILHYISDEISGGRCLS